MSRVRLALSLVAAALLLVLLWSGNQTGDDATSPIDTGSTDTVSNVGETEQGGPGGIHRRAVGTKEPAKKRDTVWFVDAVDASPLVDAVLTATSLVEQVVENGPPVHRKVVDGGRRDVVVSVNGHFELPPSTNWFIATAPGYSEVLFHRNHLRGAVGLTRLQRLNYRIELPSNVRALVNPTLCVHVCDAREGRILPEQYEWKKDRFVLRRSLEKRVGGLEDHVLVESGAYMACIDNHTAQASPWKCALVRVDSPGHATFRVSGVAGVTVQAGKPPGVVWLRRAGGEIRSETRIAQDGGAFLATEELSDGNYTIEGIGDGWRATSKPIAVSKGVAPNREAEVKLTSTPTARVSTNPSNANREISVALLRGESFRLIGQHAALGGMSAFVDKGTVFVVGVPTERVEVLVRAENQRVTRILALEGQGSYQVRFSQPKQRVAANALEFVKESARKHGSSGLVFVVDVQVSVPGNRSIWVPLVHRDFVSSPDASDERAWVLPVDEDAMAHRLSAQLFVSGRFQTVRSAKVEWR